MAEQFSLTLVCAMCRIDGMEEQKPSLEEPPRRAVPTPARGTISERKLAANRRNARLSTGPRTPRGKARSAQNSRKQGVIVRDLVIPTIEGKAAARQFERMLGALTADLRPVGALERLLTQEIAACTWRLKRTLRYENRSAYLRSLGWQPSSPPLGAIRSALSGESQQRRRDAKDAAADRSGLNEISVGEPDDVKMVGRFENHLARCLHDAIDRLERTQRDRRAASGGGATENPKRTHASREIAEHPRGGIPKL